MLAPRALALVACDPCGKKVVPPHVEHTATGCELWRVWQPFAELQRQGYGCAPGFRMTGSEWAWKDDRTLDQHVDVVTAWFDCVILPRLSWADREAGRRFIDALHRAGKAVILEVDDDLFSSEVNVRIQQTTEPDQTLEQLERKRLDRLAAMRLCDGVTVSSQRLATVMRTLTDKPVVVCPNAIDVAWWDAVVPHAVREVPGLTIGWAGGARPDDDLRPMAEAWGRIAARYPDVTFVVAGYQPAAIAERVPAERLHRLRWLPLDSYPLLYAQIDIGCAAVSDTQFNKSKTPIKCWEYSLAGAAVVATPTLYGQTVHNMYDGYLAETADEWEQALRALVENASMRAAFVRSQRRRIERGHSLAGNAWRWPAGWSEIVEDFRRRCGAPRRALATVGGAG